MLLKKHLDKLRDNPPLPQKAIEVKIAALGSGNPL